MGRKCITLLNKNSRIILSASLDKTVILWDLNTECFIHKFNHINMVTCVEFCPNVK